MILNGVFTMISVESRENNGRTYHNVNIESEDGKLLRVGTTDEVVEKLKKYQKHLGFFDIGSFKGELYMRLVDAQYPVPAK